MESKINDMDELIYRTGTDSQTCRQAYGSRRRGGEGGGVMWETGMDMYTLLYIDGAITHPEPNILECKVKWALGSITTNRASGDDGIPVELFQILKDDAVKVLHSICQQI